jgi:Fe-S cluster assembly iron-binding protein IscA
VSEKLKGICQNCSKGGILERVEVKTTGTSAASTNLDLCRRCATYPNAVWRRRFEPVEAGQSQG